MSMETMERRCAFDRCQAGGTILPTAPMVTTHSPPLPTAKWYHPGCWSALTVELDAFADENDWAKVAK